MNSLDPATLQIALEACHYRFKELLHAGVINDPAEQDRIRRHNIPMIQRVLNGGPVTETWPYRKGLKV